ncbi:5-methylcytosine-specific restriction endonuclease system specificity protein McrC [Brevibacterium sp. CSND-B09]|uniref:5-methylcytosine-specific restriction endonuclease system specificity protein McrC n=1 Tax=Brevibacterium sp. CSND-B09 TaxID=3462571 RepID=UPI00406A4DA2
MIRNVYVMMAYAFRDIRAKGQDRFAGEDFETIHDLFAEILIRGIGSQVKQGLHRDYRRRSEELATVRGRIDLTRTSAALSMVRGRVVCEFDEYELDTLHNRILKCVMILLIRKGSVSRKRQDALRRLLPYFDSVELVATASIRWSQLSFNRSSATYRMLMGTCELVIRGLLPTEDSGANSLSTWVTDEAMSSLYERFLREYYRLHHPELSPTAAKVRWNIDGEHASGVNQLPAMFTDITLRRGGRTVIIDAKYYSESMQVSQYGKSSIRSAHIYQILAYTRNADVGQNGSVSGMLLYAKTDAELQPDLDVTIQGNRIAARTLDLNLPWDLLHAQLEEIATWLD